MCASVLNVQYLQTISLLYADYETIISYNDVVTKSSAYDEICTTIPYQTEVFNLRSAMNRRKGVFTASENGRYFFSFKTRSFFNSDAQINFRVNENCLLFVEGFSTYENMPFSAVLELDVGDRVDCYLSRGSTTMNHGETFFSGILLEENVILS